MSSHFDNSFYPFSYSACQTNFKKVLRVLVASDEFAVPVINQP
jgi:hypothetical protein